MASLTGILGGLIGTLFHFIVEKVTNIRTENSWLIYLLPVGGLAIILICRLFKIDSDTGTSSIMKALREDKKIPVAIGPVIFLGTAITHLFGGSAGREGAALQLGGSIGTVVGRTFKLDSKDMHIIILCGMSSVFAALFGTPLTAAIFALEVVNAGVLFYSALIPTVVSSLVATRISALFNISPIKFNMQIPEISFASVGEVLLIAAICAGISILFCITIGYSKKLMKGMIKNDYIRIFAGGTLLLLLTIVIRTTDYNGAGMDIIERALSGEARPEAFILKLIFTTITIAAGFRGGEIVPA
ncbi:MAG TPA: chloride channel protein, partial [Clostridia bacterium]|nr:chloride channel protein [Clostridia bacterium]